MSKFLILGSNGQLGTSFRKILKLEKEDFTALDFPEIDITDRNNIEHFIESENPDHVLNCSGYTNVPKAEIEIDKAIRINGTSLKNLVDACNKKNITLCHFGTDYVFDGKKGTSYLEIDLPNPLNIYGLSKYIGEKIVVEYCRKYLIFRTSGLFGFSNLDCRNIIDKFIDLSKTNNSLRVVADEIVSVTFSEDLAKQVYQTIKRDLTGIFHCTNEGRCSWFEFAEFIFRESNISIELQKTTSGEYNKNLKKPLYSVLENSRLKKENLNIMPHWKSAVQNYLELKGCYK
ncbi:MAG: dTDP-4-dehydrorhamnose reductase [Candidatus Cloacimonetes bacterium]|nr:dTDP-4-dehydrorhamnose reductase [Candidatus Cloacimonadota bacterium]